MDHISMQQYAKERIASARAEADLHRELQQVKEEREKQRKLFSKRVAGRPWVFESAASWLRQVFALRLG